MIEEFLVNFCNPRTNLITFDELRYEQHCTKLFKFDLEKMPPMPSSILIYIKRAYLQCCNWLNACYNKTHYLDPLDFGYIIMDELLMSDTVTVEIEDGFPLPSLCKTYPRKNMSM